MKKLFIMLGMCLLLTGCGNESTDSQITEKPVELKIPESQQNVELKIPEESSNPAEEVIKESIVSVADEPYYQVYSSGGDINGTVDEIVQSIQSYAKAGWFRYSGDYVLFYLKLGDYVEDIKATPEQIEERVRQFFVNAENATKENKTAESSMTLENEETVTEPDMSVEQVIEDCMYDLEGYLGNGFTVVFYGVDTTDTDRKGEVAALALSDGTTMYLYRVGNGFYNRIDAVDLDTLNTTDSYVKENKLYVWVEYEE